MRRLQLRWGPRQRVRDTVPCCGALLHAVCGAGRLGGSGPAGVADMFFTRNVGHSLHGMQGRGVVFVCLSLRAAALPSVGAVRSALALPPVGAATAVAEQTQTGHDRT